MLTQEVWGCTAQLSPTAIPCSCWVHLSWEAWMGRKEQDTPRHRFPQSCFSACSKRTDPSPLCGDCPKREVRDLLLPQGRQSRAAPPRVKTARPVPPPQLRQNAASSNLSLQLQSLPPLAASPCSYPCSRTQAGDVHGVGPPRRAPSPAPRGSRPRAVLEPQRLQPRNPAPPFRHQQGCLSLRRLPPPSPTLLCTANTRPSPHPTLLRLGSPPGEHSAPL